MFSTRQLAGGGIRLFGEPLHGVGRPPGRSAGLAAPVLAAPVLAAPVLAAPVLAALLTVSTAAPLAAQDIEAARQQFLTSCGVCHTVEKDAAPRQGPNLAGIFGHASGQRAGFAYSEALAKAHLTFDEATLERWIEDPAAVAPGTVMSYSQANPDKRRLIIQYLKSLPP